jgi:hypothetical protein
MLFTLRDTRWIASFARTADRCGVVGRRIKSSKTSHTAVAKAFSFVISPISLAEISSEGERVFVVFSKEPYDNVRWKIVAACGVNCCFEICAAFGGRCISVADCRSPHKHKARPHDCRACRPKGLARAACTCNMQLMHTPQEPGQGP